MCDRGVNGRKHRNDLQHVLRQLLLERRLFAVDDHDLNALSLTQRKDELGTKAQRSFSTRRRIRRRKINCNRRSPFFR